MGSSSPNLAVQLHIPLKFECSVVFGYLKADVDELRKDAIELTTGTLREDDSLAPIYWEFVLPQLDKGIHVDRTGPLELGIRTPTLWRGPLSWGYGLPRFGVAPCIRDTDSHALAWPLELGIRICTLWRGPLELGIWTPTLWRGPSSWGYGLPCFGTVCNHVVPLHIMRTHVGRHILRDECVVDACGLCGSKECTTELLRNGQGKLPWSPQTFGGGQWPRLLHAIRAQTGRCTAPCVRPPCGCTACKCTSAQSIPMSLPPVAFVPHSRSGMSSSLGLRMRKKGTERALFVYTAKEKTLLP